MQRTSKWLTIVNIFGTLGYLSVLMQWAWSFLIATYPLLVSKPAFLFPDDVVVRPSHVVESNPLWTPIMVFAAGITTVIIIVITVIVILRAPKSIGKQAAHMTHSAANVIVPAFVGNEKISTKKRKKLSYQIIIVLKLTVILIPLIVLFFAGSIEQVPDQVVWVAAFFCAGCSLIYFAIQAFIAKLARIDTCMIW